MTSAAPRALRRAAANRAALSLSSSRAPARAFATSSSLRVAGEPSSQVDRSNRRTPDAVPSAPHPASSHSPLTVSLVKGLAKLMGYNSKTSTAIRVTSDLYDECARRVERQADFWYEECNLPRTYQTWFQVTNLHVWLLLCRFRALPPDLAKVYTQELVNHFFIDAEMRMRQRFGIQTARLVKGYMREMHVQHRGAVMGLDEGIATSDDDTRLAMALWRNVWGAGWGEVDGVKRKVKGIDKSAKGEDPSEEGAPELAVDKGEEAMSEKPRGAGASYAQAAAELRGGAIGEQTASSSTSTSSSSLDSDWAPSELVYPVVLDRLTTFIRREIARLASLSDAEVQLGRRASSRPTPPPSGGAFGENGAERSASVGATEAIERVGKRPHEVEGVSAVRAEGFHGEPASMAAFDRI